MPSVFVVWKEVATNDGVHRQVVSRRHRSQAAADADKETLLKSDDVGGVTELELDNARLTEGAYLHGHPSLPIAQRSLHISPPGDFQVHARWRVEVAWHDLLTIVHGQHWDYLYGNARRTVVMWGAHQLAMAYHAANGTGNFADVAEAPRRVAVDHIVAWTSDKAGPRGPVAWHRGYRGSVKYAWNEANIGVRENIRCDVLTMRDGILVPDAPDYVGTIRGTFGVTPWLTV